eukprot:CAMPEP_0115097890 /NCGR_PEP_ID=MMETSP0227-20121206/30792_1 /TAXON_ID=89957 /ORGANISM="Polarella glacialis, Strain CCMP 1383" /LENGTH=161 /DNA_ID=CAMNT_0002492309 /DNA_START=57 /DNA_END=539 /DNA_ORIENTATION=-
MPDSTVGMPNIPTVDGVLQRQSLAAAAHDNVSRAGGRALAAGGAVAGFAGHAAVSVGGHAASLASSGAQKGLKTASGLASTAAEHAVHQKQRLEKLPAHFRDLLEGYLKRKMVTIIERLSDRIPPIAKACMDDPEMPRCVKRQQDYAIDLIWPDIREEIMW